MKFKLWGIGWIMLITFLTSACYETKNNNELTEYIRQYFKKEKVEFDAELETCLIIPGGGCTSCIANGVGFVESNKEYYQKGQAKNLVVFTRINSIKILRRNIKEINEYNCIVDSKDQFYIDMKERIYPIILYLKNGEIVNVDIQSPDTGALKILEEILQKNKEI